MKDKLAWQKKVNHLLVELCGRVDELEGRVSHLVASGQAYIQVTTDKPRKHYEFVWCNEEVKGKPSLEPVVTPEKVKKHPIYKKTLKRLRRAHR